MKRFIPLVLAIQAALLLVGPKVLPATADVSDPSAIWIADHLRTDSPPDQFLDPHTGGSFYYLQNGMSVRAAGTGLSARLNQPQPKIGTGDKYSLAEIVVESADEKNYIEFGWLVSKSTNGDLKSHIFARYTAGNFDGGLNSGLARNASSPKKLGDVVAPGPMAYSIQYVANPARWVLSYNGRPMGSFAESLFGNKFTKVGRVQAFGEVLSVSKTKPRSQMGNGIYGPKAGSAQFTNLNIANGTNFQQWKFDDADVPAFYKIGAHSAVNCKQNCGMAYGGPGFTG